MKKSIMIDMLVFIITMVISTGIVYALLGSEVTFNNANTDLSATTVQGAIDELYEKSENCNKGPSLALKAGDYVQMTPTSTSYTTDTTKTGYTSTQTINPSELNLWRVISVNDNGTYDAVSEYVSSVAVTFRGEIGDNWLVGYLNTLAEQYTNKRYTVATRHMGYNGQSAYGRDTDELYTKDYNLVNSALGTLVAKNVSNKSTATAYWLASRYLYAHLETVGTQTNSYHHQCGRYITSSGSLSYSQIYEGGMGNTAYTVSYSIRPIITLRSSLHGIGSGTSADPYILS